MHEQEPKGIPVCEWQGRRLALTRAGLLLCLGIPMARALAQQAKPTATQLPQCNLRVAWRLVSSATSDRQAQGMREGELTVDTQRGLRGRFSTEWSSEQASSGRDGQMQVLVLNGMQARLRLSELTPVTTWQWLVGHRGPRDVQALGQTTWVESGQGLRVRPSWPGGQALVTLTLETDSDTATDDQRVEAETTVMAPLGQWVAVARTAVDQTRHQRGVWSTTEVAQSGKTVLEVQVSLP